MKELVTVLTLIGVGLWVVQEGTPWLYRLAVMSGDPGEFPPDLRFVGFNADAPISRQEIQRYRDISLNPRWAQDELTKSRHGKRCVSQRSAVQASFPAVVVNLADFKSQRTKSLAR